MCVSMYECLYAWIRIYVCTFICMYQYIYIYIFNLYVCVYVCMCVRLYVCMYVYFSSFLQGGGSFRIFKLYIKIHKYIQNRPFCPVSFIVTSLVTM